MPELSSQAQEVFWAFNRAASGKPEEWHYLPAIIVAALRAAADQVVPDDKPSSFSPGAPQTFAIQRRTTRRQLLTIAAELETFAQ
jgi:hypothetical protein